MNNYLPLVVLVFAVLHTCYAPPVTQNKDKDQTNENEEVGGLEDYMEYHRYLREVVNALESDPQFRDKLEKAEEHDIRSGKIAEELEFVSHNVRSRLDEIKRVELQRLRELTEKKIRLQENIDMEDPSHHHLDHTNQHTFEIEDLKKLIAKTTADLVEADKKRREEFKQYELQKEYDKQVKLNHTNGDEREKLEKEFKEREEQHKKHEKLHEPGHKAQLEEVWKDQDQMQQEFDPKTFFMLHDIDSNGLWDQDEVKALFIKELEKMYAAGHPEDDMRERAEEMERMRESVFKEVDLNRDGFIDYQEFLAQTKRNDFQQDHGWQGLDERKPYTDEELEEYIKQHQMMANQIPHGYPPPYQGHVPQPIYQQAPPGHHPNVVPVHPNGAPVHPQQFHPGQLPQQHPQQLQGNLQYNQHQPQYQQGQGNYPQPPQPNYQQGQPQQHFQGQQQHQQPNFQQPQQHQKPQQPNPQQPQQPNFQHPQQPSFQQPQQPNYQQQTYQQPQQVNNQQNQQPQQAPLQNQQVPQNVAPAQAQGQQGTAQVQASNPNLNKLESPQDNKI